MGAARARETALMLIAQGVRGIVSWGTCGGLAPELPAGSLIVARHVLATDGVRYETSGPSAALLARALRSPVRSGALLSVADPVATVQDKALLYQRYGALGVDMESAELVRTAAQCGVECWVLRVVVDPAGDALPMAVVRAVDPLGRIHLWPLLTTLGINPERWQELRRLAYHFRAARHTLTTLAALLQPGDTKSLR